MENVREAAFAWRAPGYISAEVFSVSEPSAWRSLVLTATSVQGQATRWSTMMMNGRELGSISCIPGHFSRCRCISRQVDLFYLILDWVLSHWVHFTVHSLDLVVFICVYFVPLFFILHICCVIVSTVGWILWDWSPVLRTSLPSVLWHCWLGLLTYKTRPRYEL